MNKRLSGSWWAFVIAVVVVASPASLSAQCRGCEGFICLVGCPANDRTNCGPTCVSGTNPDGGQWCANDTGGCGLGLLDGAGSIVLPTLVLKDDGPGAQLFQFASYQRLGAPRRTTPAISGEQVMVRPCDQAVVHRFYTPAVAEEKRAATEVVVL
jgi:hypothetical protein